jgi:hypothetical protein
MSAIPAGESDGEPWPTGRHGLEPAPPRAPAIGRTCGDAAIPSEPAIDRRVTPDRRVTYDRRQMIRFEDDRRSGVDRRAGNEPFEIA